SPAYSAVDPAGIDPVTRTVTGVPGTRVALVGATWRGGAAASGYWGVPSRSCVRPAIVKTTSTGSDPVAVIAKGTSTLLSARSSSTFSGEIDNPGPWGCAPAGASTANERPTDAISAAMRPTLVTATNP